MTKKTPDGTAAPGLISPDVALEISGGISYATQRRLIIAKEYPQPIVLSRNRRGRPARIAFIESEVRAWIEEKIRANRGDSAA